MTCPVEGLAGGAIDMHATVNAGESAPRAAGESSRAGEVAEAP